MNRISEKEKPEENLKKADLKGQIKTMAPVTLRWAGRSGAVYTPKTPMRAWPASSRAMGKED